MGSRFWLVEVADGLDPRARSREWRRIKRGVRVSSLTDLRAITVDTLALFLMSDEEFRAGMDTHQRISTQNIIRKYWKRVLQPQLPELN